MKLQVILGSTRPGRVSERIAKWVVSTAKTLEGVEAELVDLKDYPLEFFNEPASPRYNPNREITPAMKKWLDKVAQADAYIFVTPEYNHSIPGVLKNAIDYITSEITRKPATIVSHGTVGGARATMHLKEILSESGAAIIPKQIAMTSPREKLNEAGELSEEAKAQPYGPAHSLSSMLDELKWYSNALATARK